MNKLFVIVLLIFLKQIGFSQENYEWKNVIIGGGGYVTGFVTCPTQKNLIFAKTDVGGAYRWDEENQRWKPLTDWVSRSEIGYLGIESIAIDPQSPNRVYMAAGLEYFSQSTPSIFYSDDYGDTFKQTKVPFMIHGNGYGRGAGERLIVDPNNSDILFYASRKHGLWKSSDKALTWSKVSTFPVSTTTNAVGICTLEIDPASGTKGNSSKTIFAGVSRSGNDNLFVSYDGGDNWEPLEGHSTEYSPQRMVITTNGYLLITSANGAGPHGSTTEGLNKGALWKYHIESKTWTDITPAKSSNKAMSGITFQYDNPDVLVASTTNTWWPQNWAASKTVYGDEIFRSTDGGATWSNLFGKNRMKLDIGEFKWAAPAGKDPLSLHWATCISIDPFNSNRAFVTSGNGLFSTTNFTENTINWNLEVKGLDETVPFDIVSPPFGAPLISVIGDYDGFRHNNLDFSPQLGRHSPSMGTTQTMDFAGKNPKVVARAAKDIYYSTDNAKSWKSIIDPVTDAADGTVAVSANGKTIVWCPSKQKVYTTTDFKTWTASTGAPLGERVISDKINSNKFYIFSGRMLYYSVDGGKTFSKGAATNGLNTTGKMRAVPGFEGDLWIPERTNGLYRSVWTDGLPSFVKVVGPSRCEAVGFGKAAPGKNYPAIFIWGTLNSVEGIFRSDDEGATWVRVNDDLHEFGGPGNGDQLTGDPRVYGRVYMTTAGRGIVYGDLVDGPDAGVEIDTEYFPELIGVYDFKTSEKGLFEIQTIKGETGFILKTQGTMDYSIYSVVGNKLESGVVEGEKLFSFSNNQGLVIIRGTNNKGQTDVRKYVIQ